MAKTNSSKKTVKRTGMYSAGWDNAVADAVKLTQIALNPPSKNKLAYFLHA